MSIFRFGIVRSILIVTLLDAACMYALNVALESPIAPRSRLLFIASATGDYWQRTVVGARDAARELGIDLELEMPTPDDVVDKQFPFVLRINPANYDGVVISPADTESQIELINDLASQTKLITFDHDDRKSKRLCHVGYSQMGAGRLVARLISGQCSQPGKVALLATTFSDEARNTNVTDRLAGFEEAWGTCGQDPAMPCPIVQVATDSKAVAPVSQDLSAALADPELAFIVAFDAKSAESALKVLAARAESRRIPIIAFEPNQAIFDAIDDGRVCAAIFDDPYRSGFAAIQCLDNYRRAEITSLPSPGHGSCTLTSEVVRKENLADIRRRIRS
jgi:ribose transport system substrate-binding protein